MSDFDSCQFILIRMAYKVLISPRCDIWHQLTWSVCTGGRTLRHNQIFSDGQFTKFSYPWCSEGARFARPRAPLLLIFNSRQNKLVCSQRASKKMTWFVPLRVHLLEIHRLGSWNTLPRRRSGFFSSSWFFLPASAYGQHRKFPSHVRKTSGTQGVWGTLFEIIFTIKSTTFDGECW